jgi:membrane protein
MRATAEGRTGALIERVRRSTPELVNKVVEGLQGKDMLLVSSGLAFYALVSVAPFAVLVLWLASLAVGDDQVRQVAQQLASHAPAKLGIDKAFQRIADLGTGVGWKAILALAWPATAYGSGLVRALDRLTGDSDARDLKGLRGRGMTLGLVAMVPGLVLFGLVMAFAASGAVGDRGLARVAGWGLALVVGFAFTAAVAAFIYRVFPTRPPAWRGIWAGASAAAAAVSVTTLGFVIYLEGFADFEQRYVTSGLAAVVLLALWLFVANAVLLVGYQVAVESAPG